VCGSSYGGAARRIIGSYARSPAAGGPTDGVAGETRLHSGTRPTENAPWRSAVALRASVGTDTRGTCQKQSETIIAFARVPADARSSRRLAPHYAPPPLARSSQTKLISFGAGESAGWKILGFCPAGGLN